MAENTVRQFAERGAAVAEEAQKEHGASIRDGFQGAVDFNLQLIDMVQANMSAAFDFARQLSRVKSPSEFFEVSAAHMQKQLDSVAKQTQHFTMGQKMTTEAGRPFQAGIPQLS